MKRSFLLLIAFVGTSGLSLLGQAQSEQKPVAFDAASVKPSNDSDVVIHQRWTRNQYRGGNATLFWFIQQAFGRSQDDEIVGAPGWVKTERWDIVGEAETPGSPFPRLRTLLEDRFKLVTHVETRMLPVYELILVRGDHRLGPQISESSDAGRFQQTSGSFTAHGTPIGILVNELAWAAHGRVVDHTGLVRKYDMDLRWSVDTLGAGETAPATDAPSIFTAVQEQLGLKLQPTKAPVEILVIDHVEKPTPD